MIKDWLVSIEVARDDNGPLSDEGTAQLTALLTDSGAQPILSQSKDGTVLVSMTARGRNEFEARSTAEKALRDAANVVWSTLSLPPFTITFVEASPKG